ncbi:MAG: biopolymer transporter ExbD [Myxococcales bacterium]|nr:biopolymer transporter ExbD [Myxococcales bacterium]MDD9971473.1 biopolymer transporter ExbD [Myxococcales bacterium]
MAGGAQTDDDELITAINVTPLVDIVLVLLIVLMVTSSYLVNKAINVELPKAATGEAAPTKSLAISIDSESKLYLDGSAIEALALQAKIRQAYTEDPEVKAIISADGRVQHAKVVSVIDMLRKEKVTKFAINTSPPDTPKSEPKP